MLHWLERGSQAMFIGFCTALQLSSQDQINNMLRPGIFDGYC